MKAIAHDTDAYASIGKSVEFKRSIRNGATRRQLSQIPRTLSQYQSADGHYQSARYENKGEHNSRLKYIQARDGSTLTSENNLQCSGSIRIKDRVYNAVSSHDKMGFTTKVGVRRGPDDLQSRHFFRKEKLNDSCLRLDHLTLDTDMRTPGSTELRKHEKSEQSLLPSDRKSPCYLAEQAQIPESNNLYGIAIEDIYKTSLSFKEVPRNFHAAQRRNDIPNQPTILERCCSDAGSATKGKKPSIKPNVLWQQLINWSPAIPRKKTSPRIRCYLAIGCQVTSPVSIQSFLSINRNSYQVSPLGSQRNGSNGCVEFTMQYLVVSERFKVVVINATGLGGVKKSDNFVTTYAQACLMPNKLQKQNSKVVKRTNNPYYDFEMFFNGIKMDELHKMRLRIKIQPREHRLRSRKCLGEARLSLADYDLVTETKFLRPLQQVSDTTGDL